MATTDARRALDTARAASAQDPANREWRRQVSVTLNAVGDALKADGDLQAALAAYREGLEILRGLASEAAGDRQAQQALSGSLEAIGDMLVARGELHDGLVAYREALDIRRREYARHRGHLRALAFA